jgi:hypothetical protein
VSDALLPAARQDSKVWRRRPKRILGTRRWAKKLRAPRPRWRELPWWRAFELRVRHGWSAPQAAALAVAQAPAPAPSTRTLYRFAARIFSEWIRAKGIKLADVQIAWLRRRRLVPFYDCTCQSETRCPRLPPPQAGRHNKRGVNGRFTAKWDGSARWPENDKWCWGNAEFVPRKANSAISQSPASKESGTYSSHLISSRLRA